MGEERNEYRVFMGKPERKKPLGRARVRWEDANKHSENNKRMWTKFIRPRIGTVAGLLCTLS
jgi:hypothetical protein